MKERRKRITGSEKRPWWRSASLALFSVSGGCREDVIREWRSLPQRESPYHSLQSLLLLHQPALFNRTYIYVQTHSMWHSSCCLDRKSRPNVLTYKCQSNWKNILLLVQLQNGYWFRYSKLDMWAEMADISIMARELLQARYEAEECSWIFLTCMVMK